MLNNFLLDDGLCFHEINIVSTFFELGKFLELQSALLDFLGCMENVSIREILFVHWRPLGLCPQSNRITSLLSIYKESALI